MKEEKEIINNTSLIDLIEIAKNKLKKARDYYKEVIEDKRL